MLPGLGFYEEIAEAWMDEGECVGKFQTHAHMCIYLLRGDWLPREDKDRIPTHTTYERKLILKS